MYDRLILGILLASTLFWVLMALPPWVMGTIMAAAIVAAVIWSAGDDPTDDLE